MLEQESLQGISVDSLIKTVSQDEVIYPALRSDGEVIGDVANSLYHSVICSENYDALRMLTSTDLIGKVDCIYIDPPYNTGNKDWIYNNDYVDGSDEFRSSAFMNFLERRLKEAKLLLNPHNSVLIVTIDEKEYLNVGMLLRQVFSGARIQMVSSVINRTGAVRDNSFGRSDEYIYVVQLGDSSPLSTTLGSKWSISEEKKKKNSVTWDQLARSGTNSTRDHSPGCFYPIFIFNTDEGPVFHSVGDAIPLSEHRESVSAPEGCVPVWPIRSDGSEGCYQQTPQNLRVLIKQGYVKLGRWKGDRTPVSYVARGNRKRVEEGVYVITGHSQDGSIITELGDVSSSFVPSTQWNIPSHDATYSGSNLIKAFLGESRFDFPKSLYAVEDVLRFFVANKPNATVIDFFGGSGTTAHAVMRLNEQDGGNRRSITITNNEVSIKNNKKFSLQGLQSGDKEWEKYGVYEYATKPRITAAITGKTAKSNYTEDVQGYYKYNDFQDEYPIGDPIPKDKAKQYKDGMKQNIRFFYLDYLKYNDIYLGLSDNELYNMIWLEQGQKGKIPQDVKDYYVGHSYIIIRNVSLLKEALDNINDDIRTVYVHGDQKIAQQVHRNVSPDVDVIPLWDLYTNRMQSKTIK